VDHRLAPEIRKAEPADVPAAVEALAAAFYADPCWGHLLRSAETRAESLLTYFEAELGHTVPEHRQLWVTEDGSAAAVWARPGGWMVPAGVALREVPAMRRAFGRRFLLASRAAFQLVRRHPKGPEHWYLHYLGVVPERQGRGLGGMLMRPMLERCDREGAPAYLESSTERNRALYERNGFNVTERFHLPGQGPVVRSMWREPHAPT
jgi:ribosomal protein S18 acetylase RimI-like enzyme